MKALCVVAVAVLVAANTAAGQTPSVENGTLDARALAGALDRDRQALPKCSIANSMPSSLARPIRCGSATRWQQIHAVETTAAGRAGMDSRAALAP